MTSVWTALLVMVLGVCVDVAFVYWARFVQKLHFEGAVLSAALIQVFSILGLLFIVDEPTLLVANAAGHAVGTGLGIAMAAHNRSGK